MSGRQMETPKPGTQSLALGGEARPREVARSRMKAERGEDQRQSPEAKWRGVGWGKLGRWGKAEVSAQQLGEDASFREAGAVAALSW